MDYTYCQEAVFIRRRNRFVADVLLEGHTVSVHVRNTGRLGELLLPGASVYLVQAHGPNRKTAYDLIAVRKPQGALFNIDSLAPNSVVREWLSANHFDPIHPEYTFGRSRLDFLAVRKHQPWLIEVKGCTLVRNGVGFFPDAPTLRGARHLAELTSALEQGFRCALIFVIQTESVFSVRPNQESDPAFAEQFRLAEQAGVRIISLPCTVTETSICAVSGFSW